jgi:hypothetical protein
VFQKEISLLFLRTLKFVKKGRQDMDKVKSTTEDQKNLAEVCRLALEKSYGTQIPMPKCLDKSHRRF